jgi:hypothetical protein
MLQVKYIQEFKSIQIYSVQWKIGHKACVKCSMNKEGVKSNLILEQALKAQKGSDGMHLLLF